MAEQVLRKWRINDSLEMGPGLQGATRHEQDIHCNDAGRLY